MPPTQRKTVADKVGYLRNFLKYLQYCGVPVFIPRVPKVAESYIPYIFSEDEIERIFAAADTLPLPKAPNANVLFQVEFPMILRMLYGCGFGLESCSRFALVTLILSEAQCC